MAASAAMPGYGATLKYDTAGKGGTFSSSAIADIKAIGLSGFTSGAIDVTHLSSDNAYKEYIASGVVDAGEITLTCNFLPGTHKTAFIDVMSSRKGWKITWTDTAGSGGDTWFFDGVVTRFSVNEAGVDDAFTGAVTIKISGIPTFTTV